MSRFRMQVHAGETRVRIEFFSSNYEKRGKRFLGSLTIPVDDAVEFLQHLDKARSRDWLIEPAESRSGPRRSVPSQSVMTAD